MMEVEKRGGGGGKGREKGGRGWEDLRKKALYNTHRNRLLLVFCAAPLLFDLGFAVLLVDKL